MIRVFQLIDRWTNGEEELLSLQDLRQILFMIIEIRSLVENVMYIGVIHSYWSFIYTLCIRFVCFICAGYLLGCAKQGG